MEKIAIIALSISTVFWVAKYFSLRVTHKHFKAGNGFRAGIKFATEAVLKKCRSMKSDASTSAEHFRKLKMEHSETASDAMATAYLQVIEFIETELK